MVKKDTDKVPGIVENMIDSNEDLLLLPMVNDNQSDLDEDKNSNEDDILPPLSNPPSPYLSKDIYLMCYKSAAEQLKITRENAKLEAKSFLNNNIRSGKLITITYNYCLFLIFLIVMYILCYVLVISKTVNNSLHSDISSSDDEVMLDRSYKGNTPDDAMSLSSLSSRDEKIVENDPNILPQYPPLPNYPPQAYYYPPQFNNHYAYQYFPYTPSFSYGVPLPQTNFYELEPEPPRDRHENKNFPAEIKKY